MKWVGRIFLSLFSLGFLGLIAGIAGIAFIINFYGKDLPDYNQLKQYEPNIITRIYAGDGGLLAEYAQEKRVFVPVQKIPDVVKQAFLSAEDKNFYEHQGIDITAVARAIVINLRNSGSGRRLVGASTITQQVAKNFLLTNEVSYERKIKEAILAMRMEKALTKNQLLELYLNEIFLGQRAYGVAAAAQSYFNKSLEELTLEEAAYLAALPKAPNNYHPVRKYQAAIDRRNWVISRMVEDGYVSEAEADLAKLKPLKTERRENMQVVEADFFSEEVRRELKKRYGEKSLYQGGLSVRSSIDPRLQTIAVQTLRDGLMAYDKRHGWRGPVANLKNISPNDDKWKKRLNNIKIPEGFLDNWKLAVVLTMGKTQSTIGLEDGEKTKLTLDGVRWARKCLADCYALGPEIIKMDQVVKKGDVIMIENYNGKWHLRQVPKVQGAIIALDPHTGRVLAMQGGWTQSSSSFNRATQAQRQPGSAFKPFVYLAALENEMTPSTLVLDAPFQMEQPDGTIWSPTNYSEKVYGPSTIRMGLEKSRNLMTVRLAQEIGMDKISDYAKRFGIDNNMEEFLSYSLGAGETTLLKMTAAYGMIVNGGKKIHPTFIDRIQNRRGETIFSYDRRPCPNCGDLIRWDGQATPTILDTRERIVDEKAAYQTVTLLEGVIQRGTARRLKEIGRPLAGKTGTTNESKDTWFVGFSPNLAVGVFVGFDDPKSLGKKETGSSVAAPIWGDFMKKALKDTPAVPFRVPSGLKNVRVNLKTGQLAQAGSDNAIWEVFVKGTEPTRDDYFTENKIIGGDEYYAPMDPFAYDVNNPSFNNQIPAPIYNDGAVQVYDLNEPEETDNSFSYFSNRRRQTQQQENPQPNLGWQDQQRIERENQLREKRQLRIYNEEPRTAPTRQQQNATDPNFTGTGGIY
jgi:penicillin-binding protein 1A